jgi:hypothetical protein
MAIWICHPNGILYLQTSSLPYKKEKKKKTWCCQVPSPKSHLSAGEIIVGKWCSLRWTTTEEVFVGIDWLWLGSDSIHALYDFSYGGGRVW